MAHTVYQKFIYILILYTFSLQLNSMIFSASGDGGLSTLDQIHWLWL